MRLSMACTSNMPTDVNDKDKAFKQMIQDVLDSDEEFREALHISSLHKEPTLVKSSSK